MAILYWIYGIFVLFMFITVWVVLTPAVEQVSYAFNSTSGNLTENATAVQLINNLVLSMWHYVIIAFIVVIVFIILLASLSRQPESDVYGGEG